MSSKPHNAAQKWKPLRSTWIVGGVAGLFLVALLPEMGGFSAWVLLIGLLLLITSAYSLIFRRRSWVAFSSSKGAKIGLASGAAALLIGFVGVGLTGPDLAVAEPVASSSTSPSASLSPTPTPTPSATARIIVGGSCPKVGMTQTGESVGTASPSASGSRAAASPSASPSTKAGAGVVTFVCAENEHQEFVWMEKDVADKLKADRIAAAEQAESARVAAEEAEQQRLADEAAKAAAESQRLVQEQAAAAEAQRLAEEQARQQYVPPAPAPAPAPAPVPAPAPEPVPAPVGPNVVHPGAFCSGGVGVTKTGKPMICAPAADGRMRWISQ